MSPLPAPIAVVGCGLIGGSLLKALHRQGLALRAIERDETSRRQIQQETGAAAELTAIAECRVIVLALPVPQLLGLLPRIGELLANSEGAIVTDVAGIKEPVIEAMQRTLPASVSFIGGHPMAGKERGGYQEADAELFRGRRVALTPVPGRSEGALPIVESLWRSVGAEVLVCSASEHDAAVARVSHLPHLVAAALSRVAGRGDALSASLAASGLRDTTRVAEDPTIRHAVVRNPHVASLARDVARELLAMADKLDRHEPLDPTLDEAADARRRLFPKR